MNFADEHIKFNVSTNADYIVTFTLRKFSFSSITVNQMKAILPRQLTDSEG